MTTPIDPENRELVLHDRTLKLRAIRAPLAREPERRCLQCELNDGLPTCGAPVVFVRMCMPRGDTGRVLVRAEDAAFAERAVAELIEAAR